MVTKHEMEDLLERYRRWLDRPIESDPEAASTPSPKALRAEIGIVIVLVALVSVGALVYLA